MRFKVTKGEAVSLSLQNRSLNPKLKTPKSLNPKPLNSKPCTFILFFFEEVNGTAVMEAWKEADAAIPSPS